MSTFKIALVGLVTVFGSVAQAEEPYMDSWTNSPLGIVITSVDATLDGLDISFETDLQPPYRVAAHLPGEVGFKTRARPVVYVDTTNRFAVLPCAASDAPVFIQVYKCLPEIVPSFTRLVTEVEMNLYVRSYKRNPSSIFSSISFPYGSEAFRRALGAEESHMEKYSLAYLGFIQSPLEDFHYEVTPVGTTNRLKFAYSGRDPSVGQGFRTIAYLDDVPVYTNTTPALSAHPYMSTEILVQRGKISKSEHGEWKFALTWSVPEIFVPTDKTEPYRLYSHSYND